MLDIWEGRVGEGFISISAQHSAISRQPYALAADFIARMNPMTKTFSLGCMIC